MNHLRSYSQMSTESNCGQKMTLTMFDAKRPIGSLSHFTNPRLYQGR